MKDEIKAALTDALSALRKAFTEGNSQQICACASAIDTLFALLREPELSSPK